MGLEKWLAKGRSSEVPQANRPISAGSDQEWIKRVDLKKLAEIKK